MSETWNDLLTEAMEENQDGGPVVHYAPNQMAFSARCKGAPGRAAWTPKFVYISEDYDNFIFWFVSTRRIDV